MPMSNSNLINLCETWKNFIYSLKEVDHQRKVWLNEELWYMGSYIDDTSIFLEQYEDHVTQIKSFFNEECQGLLHHLYESVNKYKLDVQRLASLPYEQALLEDPKWKDIIEIAQATYSAIDRYQKEIENGSV
ncbi:MAG: hypothetical protein LLG04_15595 [Parachlamydia sp.]|nr:hypothetical protein [Parachlamydia sp.]